MFSLLSIVIASERSERGNPGRLKVAGCWLLVAGKIC